MTAIVRKGVLLRLDPELLARVDAERGLQARTSWLTDAVEKYLDQLSSSPQGERQSDQANERAPVAAATPADGLGVGTPSAHLSQLPRPEPCSPCLLGGASGDTAGRALGATPAVAPEGASDSEAPSPSSYARRDGWWDWTTYY